MNQGIDPQTKNYGLNMAAQGSMLWSQSSSIFANFRRKNGVFLKNQCYDQNFA
jgi:hypothetical protein